MSTTAVIFPIECVAKSDFPGYEGYYNVGSYIGDGSGLLIDKEGNFYEDDHAFGIEKCSFEEFLEDWVLDHLEDDIATYS